MVNFKVGEKNTKRWNIQHVASVGQRKNLSPRRESNRTHDLPYTGRSHTLTTELLGDSWRAYVIFTEFVVTRVQERF